MLFFKKSIKRGSPLAQFTFGCIYKFITKFTFFNSFPKNFILLCFNLDFELNSSILYDRKKDLKSGFFTLIYLTLDIRSTVSICISLSKLITYLVRI